MQKNTNVFLLVVALLLIVAPLVVTHTTRNNSLAAISGLTTTTTIVGRQQLHLFDGNNQDLGVLIGGPQGGSDGLFSTYLPGTDTLLMFDENRIFRTVKLNPATIPLVFTTTDCSGTPYVNMNGAAYNDYPQGAHVSDGGNWYKFTADPPISLQAHSSLGTGGVCYGYSGLPNVSQVTPITPPIALPLA